MHIKYPKILAVNKEECEWIFEWDVYIQEKIDWANLQIGINEWWIYIGSRTQLVYSNWELHKEFWGVEKYVLNHEWINDLLKTVNNIVLYWEWLVKHTIIYPEKYYNKFYLFDVYNLDNWEFFSQDAVYLFAEQFGIETPELFYKGKSDIEHAKTFVWKSSMEVPQEWIVIKNLWFVNKWGNKQYWKIVREEFKEANQIVFWGYSKRDIEMEFATKYVTEARVLKIVHKIEQNESRKIDVRDTPRVMWMVYNDCFMEEMREFSWKRVIDFWELQKKCWQRSRYIFHDWLNNF